jgi:hypothetical protein
VFIFLVLCFSGFAQKGILFQATKGKDTLYLCGTIHLIPQEDINQQDKIRKVLNGVDSVYFEVLSNEYESQQILRPYLSGDSLGLNTYLDSAQLRRFESFYITKLGTTQAISFPPLVNFFMLFQILTQTDSLMPMDFFYMKIAKGMGKGLGQLEITKEQFSLLESIPKEVLINALDEFVSDYDGQKKQYYRLLEAYRTEDHVQIQNVMDEDDSMQLINQEAFLFERNREMTQKITVDHKGVKILYFVGMAHLLGESGILEGLKRVGFQIKAL